MVWKKDFENVDNVVWVDSKSQRFIHLKRFNDNIQWIIRIGVKDSPNHNQEALFKNRSRAMIRIKHLFTCRTWNIN